MSQKEGISEEIAPAVGIDLGTTYSCVAVMQHGKVEVIANDMGSRTTPSWVAFTDHERFIGEAAKAQMALNPKSTVFGLLIFFFLNLLLDRSFASLHSLSISMMIGRHRIS